MYITQIDLVSTVHYKFLLNLTLLHLFELYQLLSFRPFYTVSVGRKGDEWERGGERGKTQTPELQTPDA